MDSMRSILMMLGILIHSSQVYNPNKSWLVTSDDTHPIFKILIDNIILFRMPTFFIISGFFCLMILSRKGLTSFLLNKCQRILLPLFTTVFTLNLLQFYLFSQSEFSLIRYLSSGEWVSHLWFLLNLLFYFILAAILIPNTQKDSYNLVNRIAKLICRTPTLILLLTLPFLSIAIIATNSLGVSLYSDLYNIITIYKLLSYLPYFIFGIFLFSSKELLHKFTLIDKTTLFFCLIISVSLKFYPILNNPSFNNIMQVYADTLLAWTIASCIFRFFYLFANKRSKIWSQLSNASYTVYLFHHLIVALIGSLAIKLNLAPITGMFFLLTATLFITIIIHNKIISKQPLFNLLFNGKYKKQRI
ncbi:acyltransferase family protein [Colwellia sp. Bg11-12]|uniref:acyltransferase family protein n=1 Tax=Colwellia sp. Bg11-12 TaxID=2759817 RepID=UPI003855B576